MHDLKCPKQHPVLRGSGVASKLWSEEKIRMSRSLRILTTNRLRSEAGGGGIEQVPIACFEV